MSAVSVVVLNGGSSSGVTTLARALQDVLPDPWLVLGVDELIAAMPARMVAPGGLEISSAGLVSVGEEFRTLEAAWSSGVAEMARQNARVIVDDVFLGGADSQQRWRTALRGINVLWVGVRCDPAVAEGREAGRPERVLGMASSQATAVHQGVEYDLEVDTSAASPIELAGIVAAAVGQDPTMTRS